MQVRKITAANLFTSEVTGTMVKQLAAALGKSAEYIEKMCKQTLKGATQGRGTRSSGVGELECAKLRTIVAKLLQEPNDIVSDFGAPGSSFDFEFTGPEFPDEAPAADPEPDMSKAGANKRGTGTRASSGRVRTAHGVVQQGKYVVVKQGVKCNEQNDPDKFEIWKHVWASTSFEEYYKNAPAKGVTRTGRIITAASEMGWAIKCGWIKPVAA